MGGASDDQVAADLELFASFVRDDERREREAKAAAKAERRAANERRALGQAKDDAAAALKRLRGRDGVDPAERAAAEEAYRQALAAVVAAETGEAPTWAPAAEEAPAPEPEAEPEPVPEAEPDGSPDDHAE